MFYKKRRISSLYDALHSKEDDYSKYIKKLLKNDRDVLGLCVAVHRCFSTGFIPDKKVDILKELCSKKGFNKTFEKAQLIYDKTDFILGFDPSLTNTGWSINTFIDGEFYVVDKGISKTSGKDLMPLRYLSHQIVIDQLLNMYQPDFVGVEKPQHDSSWSAGLYPLWVMISNSCIRHRTPVLYLMPSQVQKIARGILDKKGSISKLDMVDAAKTISGNIEGTLNHNIADAIIVAQGACILHALLNNSLKESSLNKDDKEMFTKQVKRRKTGRIEGTGIIYKEGDAYLNLKSSVYDDFYQHLRNI